MAKEQQISNFGLSSYNFCISESLETSHISISTSEVCHPQSKIGVAPYQLHLVPYLDQKATWPPKGRHILAHTSHDNIVVYQAFKPLIAEWATQHQKFGGPLYSFSRMSWIKTNFLWMMYRSDWGRKRDQERILAIHLRVEDFKKILRSAFSSEAQKRLQLQGVEVRLQWDPDHDPSGWNQERKAIQLGLRGETLKRFNDEWIRRVDDVTDFVAGQRSSVDANKFEELMMPMEQVLEVEDDIANQIDMT
jgi:hypothetical protein